jgi:hypothetical protein
MDRVDLGRYNGWTNRETWATSLWLTNDETLYSLASSCSDPEELKEFVESLLYPEERDPQEPEWLNSMREDIGSLWRVDFREIWENLHGGESEAEDEAK